MWRAIALILLASVGSACTPDKWEGWVYPNRDNLTRHVALGQFRSLEECRAAALKRIEALHAESRADYECGLNCKASEYGDIKICKETVR